MMNCKGFLEGGECGLVLFQHLPGGIEETHEEPLDMQCPS
jgi:hypothetical protein